MNTQEYISSGIIEAYVTGIAEEQEARELERLALQYPEIRRAIDDVAQTMEQYAAAHAVTPPDGLRRQIWQQLEQESLLEKTQLDEATAIASDSMPGRPLFTVQKNNIWRYATAASVALLIASGLGNMYLMHKNISGREEMALMEQEQQKVNSERNIVSALKEQSQSALKTLLDPDVKSVALNGVGTHTGSKAMLYWNSHSGEVFLSLRNMPEAPEGKQYQLWAIVDGKPVDAGMYAFNEVHLLQMKNIPRAEMFAITIEKEGGSPTPTMEQMVVAGKPG